MTTRSLTLVQALFIALVISLMAPAARSQEQQQPGVQPQEKAAVEPSQQKPAETAPEQHQGEVIIPQQGEKAPENAPETVEAAPQKAPEKTPEKTAEGGGTYTIKQGDTLWDISNTFLKDPFLWPFIWKANQYITNPDLIYPGNHLAIPSLAPIERALQAPAAPQKQQEELVAKQTTTAQKTEEVKAPANKFTAPEEAPVPLVDKYAMLSAGFVNLEESNDVIVGSKEGKTIFAYDDIVYVTIRSKKAAVGDKFTIYSLLKKIKHPVTGENYGRLAKVLGILRITEKGKEDTYAARITLSFDASETGDMLTPYQEPTLVFNTPQEKPKDINGYILEVMDGRTINALTDIVYLDKGSEDGVDPGDRFTVYGKPQNKNYPKVVIGEARVFLVKARTATAIVTKSANFITRGDEVAYTKTATPADSSSSPPEESVKNP